MKVILLSGGSGQRLWPLSNDSYSKQYIKFIKHDEEAAPEGTALKCSMLQRVYEQLSAVGLGQDVIIAASEPQREIIESQLGGRVEISVEPMRRDTFPAVLLASAYVRTRLGAALDEVVCFVPVDPYVHLDYFKKIIELADIVKALDGVIGLLGAKPTYPSQKYGYIRKMDSADGTGNSCIRVAGFEEKPDLKRAGELVESGALWNCGVFCFCLRTAQRWAEKYQLPFDYEVLHQDDNYTKLPKKSFDYEILEHWNDIVALSYDGMWKDIGTWNTLTEEMEEHSIGNVVVDDTSENCHVISTLDIPVILMGGKNLVVAASRDGILVSDKEQSSFLKKSLDKVKLTPRYEERRWGTIKTVERSEEDGIGVCTNMIKVESGQSTTYHRHMHHDEIITIISGKGVLILNGTKIVLTPGVTFTINAGVLHAIKAEEKLKYVEVLMGDLSGDDIERISWEI